MASKVPLNQLRVLELAGWNGVLAGRLLADGGADVVRVVPTAGDSLDDEPPFFGESDQSIQSAWYNAGKRVLELDLASVHGRQKLLELVARADVLIEDWAPGSPLLPDDELQQANGRLVRVSVTPMGLDGPLRDLTTNDLVANALSGAASVTGNADSPPITGYGNQSYHTVGLYTAICALAAVRAARATGHGQHVDLSAHEALVSCTEQVLMQWFFPGGTWHTGVAKRQGSLHWSTAYEVYEASDGKGVMVTAALNFAKVLLPWLKEEGAAQDLADPEKYPTLVSMIRDLPYVMKVLKDWVALHEGDELFYEAQRRHQPFAVVWNIAEALASPQIAARRYLQPRDISGFGEVQFPGRFFQTSADEGRPALAVKVADGDLDWAPRTSPGAKGGVASSTKPLAGVRVLDFTHVLAGPFGTRVLGDLGAEVIKISAASRGAGANTPDHPYYMCWNRNKRNISLNMQTEEARALARKLATTSDIIIDNFSAGVLARWGLDRAAVATANPGVTAIAMGGMGKDGPWRDFVTFAPTIHALTGLTYLTNPPGRHDLGYGFSLTDHLSGLLGAFAALEGLEHRERTGEGLDIDLAQYELGLGIMAPALLDNLANGVNPEPVGNRHPFAAWAPHGIYRCAGDDRWVAIAARGDEQWRALCGVMGLPMLVDDARFATHEARIANEDALDRVMEFWTSMRDRYAVMAMLQEAGIAAGVVQDAEDLATCDEQLKARGFFGSAAAEIWGEYGLDRFPAKFNGERPAEYEGVHQVGEDTFDIATTMLGLGDEEVADLVAKGVFT
jgi:crotonobetainyl-CoA:carnitine CoA-transferase CaiB-like acyl-CoA transferase